MPLEICPRIDAEAAGAVAVEQDLEFLAAAFGVDVDGEEAGDAAEAADGFFGDLEEGAGVFAVEVHRHAGIRDAAAAGGASAVDDAGGELKFLAEIRLDVVAVHGTGGLGCEAEDALHAAGECRCG